MTESKYSTFAGIPTRAESYSKLKHHLSEARDQAQVISHLHNTEDSEKDKLIAKAWNLVAIQLKRFEEQVTLLMMNKLQ